MGNDMNLQSPPGFGNLLLATLLPSDSFGSDHLLTMRTALPPSTPTRRRASLS
jgi:hypothetical protein